MKPIEDGLSLVSLEEWTNDEKGSSTEPDYDIEDDDNMSNSHELVGPSRDVKMLYIDRHQLGKSHDLLLPQGEEWRMIKNLESRMRPRSLANPSVEFSSDNKLSKITRKFSKNRGENRSSLCASCYSSEFSIDHHPSHSYTNCYSFTDSKSILPGAQYRSSSAVARLNSFWLRVFRRTPFRKSELFRTPVIRVDECSIVKDVDFGWKDILFTIIWIAFGWIFYGIHWSFLLIYDVLLSNQSESCDITNFRDGFTAFPSSSPTVDTAEERHHFEVNGRDLAFEWMHLLSQTVVIAPIYSTITLYLYTNLRSKKGREFAVRVIFIYLLIVAFSFPLAIYHSGEANQLDALLILYGTYGTLLLIVWQLLVKILGLKWRINVCWLPAILVCYICVFIICRMPTVFREEFLEQIVLYIPLLFMVIEWMFVNVIGYMLDGQEETDIALTFSIAYISFPMEFARFISFVVIWKEYKDGAPPQHVLWYAFFTLIGEIYTHTQLYVLLRSEIKIRFRGTRCDSFQKNHYYFSSIRSYLEFVAPTFFAVYVLFARFFDCHMMIMGNTYNFTYQPNSITIKDFLPILWIYYGLEFIMECICQLIRMMSAYAHISAIGNLKCGALFMMIVYVGSLATVTSSTTVFLSIMIQNP